MTMKRNEGMSDGVEGKHAAFGPGERGSILIPVAIALLALLAFSAFTIDNGVMLSSRRQIQNAADSAALAAALYLAWDDGTNLAGARAAAIAAAQQHAVWGQAPDITAADVTFPSCPPGAPGPVDQCVRVNVFRNQRADGSPLPAFFATLAGVTSQGVRATATAQVLYGASSDCLLPFAIPDRWLEVREDEAGALPDESPLNYPDDEVEGLSNLPDGYWDPDDTYDAYVSSGQTGGDALPGTPGVDVDLYLEGSPAVGGTGYDGFRDHGLRVLLKAANGDQIAPSFYYPIVLPDGGGNGADPYRQRIRRCSDAVLGDATLVARETGNMVGPTRQGIEELIALDPGASWDPTHVNPDGTLGTIVGGCMAAGTCGRSPRWRAVPTFDVDNYMSGHRTGRGDIVTSAYVGIFVQGMVGNDVLGYLTSFNFDPNAGNLTDDTSSFLRTVILVR